MSSRRPPSCGLWVVAELRHICQRVAEVRGPAERVRQIRKGRGPIFGLRFVADVEDHSANDGYPGVLPVRIGGCVLTMRPAQNLCDILGIGNISIREEPNLGERIES